MGLFSQLRDGPSSRPFDRAELKDEHGSGSKSLTPEQYDALPLNIKVNALLNKRVRFFKGNEEVPSNKATLRG